MSRLIVSAIMIVLALGVLGGVVRAFFLNWTRP